ncbi:DUF1971 domain-containing protein [Fusobacterium sp.]|uniref:DUF1971 domain-containing protein n=1 Tax=Fusobacterium sp. TaxID=68766 RepID=UPI002902DE93|nr:DUF1971 domain-containing protein [Fusobacterium sp.]MDU1911474.1 DUF1971 domain-containing protein [Fusobacterium sp.]
MFQSEQLPVNLKKIGETPIMSEKDILKEIVESHTSPKGKYGYLVIIEGTADFVWEDEPDKIYTADKHHPIVIFPERKHHVIITGPVKLKVEFYSDNIEFLSPDIEASASEVTAEKIKEKIDKGEA